jgi:hypothetical protein
MLAIGNRVEIMGRPGDRGLGKYGDIVHVDTGIRAVAQPVSAILPQRPTQRLYSVRLNSGDVVHRLTEQHLRLL